MEHKVDDFFRKKVEKAADGSPGNSCFDEGLFWDELQKNMNKPKQKRGLWWITAAAGLAGILILAFFASKSDPVVAPHPVAVRESKPSATPMAANKVISHKQRILHVKKTPDKGTVEPLKESEPAIAKLTIRIPKTEMQPLTVTPDSIAFKHLMTVDTQPKFKTVHVNEISDTEKNPVPQPRFKIRFAARNPH